MLTEILIAIAILAILLLWVKVFIHNSSQRGHDNPAPKNKRDAGQAHREQHALED